MTTPVDDDMLRDLLCVLGYLAPVVRASVAQGHPDAEAAARWIDHAGTVTHRELVRRGLVADDLAEPVH